MITDPGFCGPPAGRPLREPSSHPVSAGTKPVIGKNACHLRMAFTMLPGLAARPCIPLPKTHFGASGNPGTMKELPETHYAKADDGVHIAHQVFWAGSIDRGSRQLFLVSG